MKKQDKFILFEVIGFMIMLFLTSLFIGFCINKIIDYETISEFVYIMLGVLAVLSLIIFGSASLLRKGYEKGKKTNDES